MVIGDTEAQAFLEKFVGFLGGFIVLAIGLVLWIPRELEDRQRAEEALRDSEERLKNQVADLRDREERLETQSADLVDYAENLAAARDELQQLNDQKDKFFSIIAHDLRGPFNALLGYSDLLSSGIAGADQDKVAEYGNAVHQSAQSVFKLLENLLEWSRLQMGRLDIELAPVDLGHVIDTNLKLFEPIAKEKAIRLIGNTSQPLEAFADAHTIDTVVRNLVNNAIKFTPAKGSVTIDAARNGDWAEIEVSDTGVGISADRVARLFRLDEKTSTVGTFGETGTGLGLHLCKELVERQGGRIAVESTEGEGSVFRLSLPLHHR
ncbi:MAG: HAMP domain-containing sensor histidine kinase [Alphaproteobacteria bacterium]